MCGCPGRLRSKPEDAVPRHLSRDAGGEECVCRRYRHARTFFEHPVIFPCELTPCVHVAVPGGSTPHGAITDNPSIHLRLIPNQPAWISRLPRSIGLPFKALFQFFALLLVRCDSYSDDRCAVRRDSSTVHKGRRKKAGQWAMQQARTGCHRVGRRRCSFRSEDARTSCFRHLHASPRLSARRPFHSLASLSERQPSLCVHKSRLSAFLHACP